MGSVSGVALHHAVELSKYFRVTLVSDSFPDTGQTGVEFLKVTPRRFDYLRRFCHVPNEYSFATSVRHDIEMMHKDNAIDMTICHGHAVATLSAKPLKEKYGIPYALVTHGDIFDRPKGTYDWRLTVFYKWLTPTAYRNADLILALSPHMAACAIKGGSSPGVVKVVPNGIDPADIGLDENTLQVRGKRERKKNDPIRLLFVGRLSVEKGVDILIRACKILKERNVPFSLDVIGTGPLKKALDAMVVEAHLADRITFLDKIERRLLGTHYQKADLVCVPSVSDPLPTVVLEALLTGVPVLGSDVGGIPFIVETGKNGVIVPHLDASPTADAIEGLYRNNEVLAYLTENACASVHPRFLWDTVGQRIGSAIEETLARHRHELLSSELRFVR